MRVTKAQAQANRAHIVETASVLFRERGYDGVGIADLMAAAGFTHGGFYKHFASKADLMAEAATCGLTQSLDEYAGQDIVQFFDMYLSREHRDTRGTGCTLAALCADAARQPEAIKAAFAHGIEGMLAGVERSGKTLVDVDPQTRRAKMLDALAHAVGAVVLSRACPDDSPLADEILDACRTEVLAPLLPKAGG